MIELIIALYLFLGYSPEEAAKLADSDTSEITQSADGLGSTVNGTTTVVLNGTTYIVALDEKGNYVFIKK